MPVIFPKVWRIDYKSLYSYTDACRETKMFHNSNQSTLFSILERLQQIFTNSTSLIKIPSSQHLLGNTTFTITEGKIVGNPFALLKIFHPSISIGNENQTTLLLYTIDLKTIKVIVTNILNYPEIHKPGKIYHWFPNVIWLLLFLVIFILIYWKSSAKPTKMGCYHHFIYF